MLRQELSSLAPPSLHKERRISSEPQEELREGWFAKSIRPAPPTSLPPPRPPERAHTLTALYGAIAGALGGGAALALASWVSGRVGAPYDVAWMVGHTIGRSQLTGFAAGAVVGAVLGGLLALVMRHSARFIARVIFGAAASAALWFCWHIALVSRHHATLPLVPMLLGACAYGAIVALVPPARGRVSA